MKTFSSDAHGPLWVRRLDNTRYSPLTFIVVDEIREKQLTPGLACHSADLVVFA